MLRADPSQSLSSWLRDATARLDAAGSPSARVEAERLAAHGLGVTWSDLWKRPDVELAKGELDALEPLVERRAGGEPFAYIVGSVVFHGIEITCSPDAFVPRPETETLVDLGLELIGDAERPVVVEVGTGSGAVCIAIATARPDAVVWAIDVSADALRLAERNVRTHAVNVHLVCGDLFDALPDDIRGSVDLIVSNPPYVPDGASVQSDVKREPRVAIYGGGDGTDILQRLWREAPAWLCRGGAIALEVGERWQGDMLAGASMSPDHNGRPRVAWARV